MSFFIYYIFVYIMLSCLYMSTQGIFYTNSCIMHLFIVTAWYRLMCESVTIMENEIFTRLKYDLILHIIFQLSRPALINIFKLTILYIFSPYLARLTQNNYDLFGRRIKIQIQTLIQMKMQRWR